ncbi:MAG: leucine--tRNA ligase [Armatimonadetes bacterium]|nr:leucine--tRNA ligase [Armatimonadota bacterium]
MRRRYEPDQFEARWRERWRDADLFRTRDEDGRPKFYALDYFPYPSGAGLSVGHCRNYIPTDVLCRMKYMQGFNVLHPMGFDAFGLPAEVEALNRGVHPAPMIDEYAANYKRQMELIGIGFDWSRSFKSSDPQYYRWTQWIFKLLFERGLAYRKDAAVNWCAYDKTVLADEEVVGGLCWRCDNPVEKKNIPQWFFKITEYADRLIDDLDDLDWPEGIKNQQRNWIGRSVGLEFEMSLAVSPAGASATSPSPGSRQVDEGSDPELEALKAEVAAEGATADPAVTEKIEEIKTKLDDKAAEAAAGQAEFERAAAAIGGTLGALEAKLPIKKHSFRVFTTRIDTIFGMTFCVLAPEHPLVNVIIGVTDAEHSAAIYGYCEKAKGLSDIDRQATNREKTGVYTGVDAINPANGKRVPIWIADYVMMGYGTGAIMAVPGHDARDYEFAKKYRLDVVPVIAPVGAEGLSPPWGRAGEGAAADTGETPSLTLPQGGGDTSEEAFESAFSVSLPFSTEDGVMINSGEYTGMTVKDGQKSLSDWIIANGFGEAKTNYKLRDWLISRQRYWGCPIPIIHDKDGEMHAVQDDLLPIELPDVENYEPPDDGTGPLALIPDFVNVTDPDGRLGRRETDTMGGFACSSWYFLRFCDPHNYDEAWSNDAAEHWMPVDCYVGGAEHAVMHLLYARFWTKVLYDAGYVKVKEPFARLMNQGMVLAPTPYRRPREGEQLKVGEDGIQITAEEARQLPEDEVFWRDAKMSKSKGNVVTPEQAVERHGADGLRVFELFVAPFEQSFTWSEEAIQGSTRFLSRVFKLAAELAKHYVSDWHSEIDSVGKDGIIRDVRRATHQLIAGATKDIESFSFNTYIAKLMTHVNTINALLKRATKPSDDEKLALSETLDSMILVLSPAAPHTADEIWSDIGHREFVYEASWPIANEYLAKPEEITIAVQVNGKLRDTITMPADASDEELESSAKASATVQKHLEGKTVRKVIVVPGRLVNIVAD